MNKIEKDSTNFILKVKNTDDLQAAVNADMERQVSMYDKGYEDCANDRRKISKALKRAAEKDFQEDLEVIDDVMSSPFDVEHK